MNAHQPRRFVCFVVLSTLAMSSLTLTAAPLDLRDPARKHRAAQITSSFENSTTQLQYDYVQNITDGRGLTAGRAGFTSATGDLLLVVERYQQLRPGNALVRFLPALRAVNGSASTRGLSGFASAWKAAADNDPQQRRAQDDVESRLYFRPALGYARRHHIVTALGQAALWDTIIQHGDGSDRDGLGRILQETVTAMAGSVQGNEPAWILRFLAIRRTHLLNAADPSTRTAWRQSVGRVDALSALARHNKWTLSPPLRWTVYGDTFTLR